MPSLSKCLRLCCWRTRESFQTEYCAEHKEIKSPGFYTPMDIAPSEYDTPNTQSESPRECLCMVCSQEYPVWYAPNDLWNVVMRTPDGREASEKVPFICPLCFTKEAERQGVHPTVWKLTAEQKGENTQGDTPPIQPDTSTEADHLKAFMEGLGFHIEHFGDEVDGTAEPCFVNKWPKEGLEIPIDIAAFFYQALERERLEGKVEELEAEVSGFKKGLVGAREDTCFVFQPILAVMDRRIKRYKDQLSTLTNKDKDSEDK